MNIEEMVSKKEGHIFPCINLLLVWLSFSDGDVDISELEFLKAVTPSNEDYSFDDYKRLLTNDPIKNIFSACKILSRSLDFEEGNRVLELLIGMMVADNKASYPEIHIIRFIADLFCVTKKQLDQIYSNTTGKPFPEPGDLSSVSWWQKKEDQRKKQSNQKEENKDQQQQTHGIDDKIVWALNVLSLESPASKYEIKQAYHRMCNNHHPDKFEKLGPEAAAAANIIFKKINEAYEVLTLV